VPELAVEIVSPNEGDGVTWDDKLARYHELGVKEGRVAEAKRAETAEARVRELEEELRRARSGNRSGAS
jgi:Uma2 family endonuclease